MRHALSGWPGRWKLTVRVSCRFPRDGCAAPFWFSEPEPAGTGAGVFISNIGPVRAGRRWPGINGKGIGSAGMMPCLSMAEEIDSSPPRDRLAALAALPSVFCDHGFHWLSLVEFSIFFQNVEDERESVFRDGGLYLHSFVSIITVPSPHDGEVIQAEISARTPVVPPLDRRI
jgi:hypothetical protein